MQVKELGSKGLKHDYRITVEAAQINAQMEAELKRAGEQVKIPGFRPGFIPMKVLQQRYGKAVQPDVLKQVINQASTDVIREKKLRPALMPQINIEEYKEGQGLTFTMAVEVFPDVPTMNFGKITLERSVVDITEQDIDEAVQRVAERSPKFNRIKEGGKAQKGNVVTIDFKGMMDGVAFEGGSANDFRLELGSGQFIEGFEDQLIGAKEGDDRTVEVTFPKEYASEQLAGKPATFAVKVKEIYTKETPEVDDAFAKERGFADLRALREAVRNQLIKEYDNVVRSQLKKQLFDQLEEQYDFELPQGMVELEFKSIWDRLKQAQAQGDESLKGKTDDEMKEEYQQIARRRVKLGLMLAEVGTRNNIQITRDELTRAVMQQASQFPGQEKKVVEFYQKNPERADDLRGPILEEKSVDWILDKVQFNDRKVTVAELNSSEEEGEAAKKPAKAKTKAEPKKKKA